MSGIAVVKLPVGRMPTHPGEVAFQPRIPRPDRDPQDGPEWHITAPCGHTFALRSPDHIVQDDEQGRLTVSPSIVCPHGDYHGFLVYGRMTDA